MLRKELLKHFLITAVFFGAITILRLFHKGISVNHLIDLVFLWAGAAFGTQILDIDHLIYAFVTYPGTEYSTKVRNLFRAGDWRGVFTTIAENHKSFEPPHLIFHTAIFQPIFYVFCFFVLTSSGSFFGAGLVMAAALHLLKDEWEDWLQNRPRLSAWLFWQFANISPQAQRTYLYAMTATFVLLSFFLI